MARKINMKLINILTEKLIDISGNLVYHFTNDVSLKYILYNNELLGSDLNVMYNLKRKNRDWMRTLPKMDYGISVTRDKNIIKKNENNLTI